MRKWIKWVILVGVVIIVGFVFFNGYHFFIEIKMSDALVTSANKALASGITIQDDKNDFANMEAKPVGSKEKPNNPHPYNFPYLDLKSFSVGIDDEYFYYKAIYYSDIPQHAINLDGKGDMLQGTNSKVSILDKSGVEQAVLTIEYGFQPILNLPASLNTYYADGPTGIQEPENKRFEREEKNSKVAGGSGTNYLMGAFPLEHLGVKKGDTIYFSTCGETGSSVYDHSAMDCLKGVEKMPATIIWNTNTNKFEIVNPANY